MLRTIRPSARCYPRASARQSSSQALLTLGHVDAPLRVLVVGDGNFSYARALSRATTATILATSFDTRDALTAMYPTAPANIAAMSLPHAVRHGIDATQLERYGDLPGPFDRIVFNFPHSYAADGGRHNKISEHRKLLTQFFQSAASVLSPRGQIWVALCAGQGGTPAETVQRKPGDTWQVAQCAASAQLLLTAVEPFPIRDLQLLGYESAGYRLGAKGFYTNGSLVHIFCRDDQDDVRAAFPLQWTRDMSFWTQNSDWSSAKHGDALHELLQRIWRGAIEVRGVRCVDEYTCPTTRRKSLCFRVALETYTKAYSDADMVALLATAGRAMGEAHLGEYRAPTS
ncbi:hypothetical protein SDRG_06378 [Saprolegnia diclina VS20]|uniref:FDX-ACB domain-containing protein n=1 Tax=Saprolegnia diclina (strain VS20) TaxID=1156394 RepID=T0RUW6_SAPDV|nr:hypothetical protein SDRG_06378 [Saprolegnia diclina VS20]EQC36273.1 hypothetical protein SDRG_06378 [Saprolegnia diclina VS20]|eukprot:XP_008610379.1 hypothetical protein SDRG_06378 [Saprolegnia diclina VS20]